MGDVVGKSRLGFDMRRYQFL